MNLGGLRGFTVYPLPDGMTYPQLEIRFFHGTARYFNALDINKVITTTNGSAVTLTLFPLKLRAGECIHIKQKGAGQVTIVAGSGVTIDVASTVKKTRAKYSVVSLMLESSNREGSQVWTLFGDFALS